MFVPPSWGIYVQVHQYDEPCNTINIDQTVGAIDPGPQYNLQEQFFKEPTKREIPRTLTLYPYQYD